MKTRTFTVYATRCDIEPSRDGMVAVMNGYPTSSGKAIRVRSVRSVQPSGQNPTLTAAAGTQGSIGLYRTTATSGGTAKAMAKMDTGAASLPAGVTLTEMPDSVTKAGLVRKFGDAFSFGITQAVPFQANIRAPGVCDSRDNPDGHHVWWGRMDDALERIILREGEGLAAVKTDYGYPQSYHWSVGFRVEGTGKCYRAALSDNGTPSEVNAPIWSLFNASGSGVVLGVYVVGFPDFGESNIPRARVARITGLRWLSGDTPRAASVVAHDTDAELSGITAWCGPFVAECEGKGSGIPIDYTDYQPLPIPIMNQQKAGSFRQYLESDPWISLTHIPQIRFGDDDMVWSACYDCPIVINPGEGLAVLGGGNGLVEASEMAYCDYEIICELVQGERTAAPAYIAGVA